MFTFPSVIHHHIGIYCSSHACSGVAKVSLVVLRDQIEICLSACEVLALDELYEPRWSQRGTTRDTALIHNPIIIRRRFTQASKTNSPRSSVLWEPPNNPDTVHSQVGQPLS